MERVLHIPKPDGYLIKAHWVAMAEYKKGCVMLSFAPKLKPYLLNLKREFTKYDLVIATQFQSIYAIRIYQLLKQYKGIGYREFNVDELKEILGIKPNEYREFKRFRGRVLNQAKKEFEKKDESGKFKCDLTFNLETFREGRRIAWLKFIIIEQEYHQAPAIVSVADERQREKESKPPEGVKERLVYYGISAKQADGFIRSIGEEDREELLSEFEDSLERFMLKYFYKEGIQSVVVRGSFFEFLEKKFSGEKAL